MTSPTLAPTIPTGHPLLSHYEPLLAQLLYTRGLLTESDAEKFLSPSYEENYNPFLLYNTKEAVTRIYEAIINKERIAIYADYDADGIPGSVILSSLLEKIGYDNYSVYLPHRHDEGYGIHIEALSKIKDEGASLVISIDVGITGHEAALWCREHGIDLIITDHHLPSQDEHGNELLPAALLVVNPKQDACSYPDDMLCGSGVIFKVVQAFIQNHGEEFSIPMGWEKWLLDMVGIATLSDMVPLKKENRIFAYYGMKVIKKTRRKGLQELLKDLGVPIRYLTEEDIAFGISPKINAASRMSHPEEAYQLFMAKTALDAKQKADHLIGLNNERKTLVATTMKKAYKKLAGQEIGPAIVIGAPDWKAGILGLIASKLVEKYHVPAFVWSEENGEIKGSCRSLNGLHVVEIMNGAEAGTFIQFGGHAEAGGFSCLKNEVHFLKERLEKSVSEYQEKNLSSDENHEIVIDAVLALEDISYSHYKEIEKLAPFGVANEKPLFLLKNVVPTHVGQFGKTKEHLEVHFNNSRGEKVRAISFFANAESYSFPFVQKVPINLIAHLEHSVFRGHHELRLKIVDCVEPE